MDSKYDAIIIGSGISGLICGSYLVKKGFKVLIAEQFFSAGGCCGSFLRNGFHFDVGVHYLGSLKNGVLGEILKELDLYNELQFVSCDPSDKVVFPDFSFSIWRDSLNTFKEMADIFPKEKKALQDFFETVRSSSLLELIKKYNGITFEDYLSRKFSDYKLISALQVLLGNIGASAENVMAIPSFILFKQYIFDNGHYPIGGMGNFVKMLVDSYIKNGGAILYNAQVSQILFDGNHVSGVLIDNHGRFRSNIVVSASDATRTFSDLICKKNLESEKIRQMQVGMSMFIVYLGLKNKEGWRDQFMESIWHFEDYNIKKAFSPSAEMIKGKKLKWLVISSSKSGNNFIPEKGFKKSLLLMRMAPYVNEKFWDDEREGQQKEMIGAAEKLLGRSLDYDVAFNATPVTIKKYTLNHQGSFVGWDPSAHFKNLKYGVRNITSLKGLYCAGHWVNSRYLPSSGVPNVAYSGRCVAKLIVEDFKKYWDHSEIRL